jgi:hypothetical protein
LQRYNSILLIFKACVEWDSKAWFGLDALVSRAELVNLFRDRLGALMNISDSTLDKWLDTTCARYPVLRKWDSSIKRKVETGGSNELKIAADVTVPASDKQKIEKVAYTESRAQHSFANVCI